MTSAKRMIKNKTSMDFPEKKLIEDDKLMPNEIGTYWKLRVDICRHCLATTKSGMGPSLPPSPPPSAGRPLPLITGHF